MPKASDSVQLVRHLVERFDMHRDAYLSGRYNEAQLRKEFVDPFFKALGWDVENEQGRAEQYKEVIHEDAIKISASSYTKAPDYCFRIGGVRKFFVEAKKPSVDIKADPLPAFQLRRYAWSAKLPLSILTDFEEFAVYDTRIKPDQDDPASTARTLFFRYTEYVERWHEISSVFSQDAILNGSFDKYAETARGKRGTATVDEAFLVEIEGWRAELARNIALRNPDLSVRDLNFAVQATIDRVVFLRISEDRGTEEYGDLLSLVNGGRIYQRLFEAFDRADARYNSGLFHFTKERGRHGTPDELTRTLEIDDKPLREIIFALYYPRSPYEFSVLSADILGQVYEQFLGKVIRLTPGHRAVVEEKPEVKKAGGVFYTPTYVVQFIVEQTIGDLVHGRTPGEISGNKRRPPLRVVDPACGSGSFLLGAYEFLLEWYRGAYVSEDPGKYSKGKNPKLYQATANTWKLTTGERKRILLTHIFGVDIDAQAVEVTKLSLLLKVLEGESSQTLQAAFRLFHERALPDLDGNIKSGNSLVGPDFFEQAELPELIDDDARFRVNPFDWVEEFPEVFGGRAAGFDAVIGNPPYIRMELFKELKDYLRAKYAVHDERSDMYAYFVERAHKLLSETGRFSMILSNKFLRANYGGPLRRFLRQRATLLRVVDLAGLPVFKEATVRTAVFVTTRKKSAEPPIVYSPPPNASGFRAVVAARVSLADEAARSAYQIPAKTLDKVTWSFAETDAEDLLTDLKARFTSLTQYCNGQIMMGVKSGLSEAFVIDKATRDRIVAQNPAAHDILKPFVSGRDIRSYRVDWKQQYLIYTHHGIDMKKYPAVRRHLEPFRAQLENRATEQEWYELQQPQLRFAPHMDGPKIIFPDIAPEPRFALDSLGCYGSNTTYFIPRSEAYLVGLLNSRLATFYFRLTCAGLEGKNETYLRFFGQYLEGFPVRPVENGDRRAETLKRDIERLVAKSADLQEQLSGTKVASHRATIMRQMQGVSRRIDSAVYKLYDLSADQAAVIERIANA